MKAPLALGVLVLVPGLGSVEIGASHEVGEVRVTEVAVQATSTLLSSKTYVEGEELPVPDVMSRTIETRLDVAFRDRTRAVVDGRRTGLDRAITAAERTSAMRMRDPYGGEHASDSARRSSLLEVELRFDWDEEAGRLVGRRADGEALAGLRAAPDWAAWIPTSPVEPGDSWEVPIECLGSIREPGGELDLRPQGGADRDRELLPPAGSVEYAGSIVATLVDADADTATVRLDVRGSSTLDLTPFLPEEELVDHGAGPHRPTIDTVVIDTTFEGAGELRWDLRAGRLVSLALELESHEVETVDFGHTQLAPGLGPRLHDVRIESVSESRIVERIAATVRPDRSRSSLGSRHPSSR